MKRCIHIDFHTMPGIEDFAKNIHGEEVAQILSDAHVTYVNLFARCNVGFSYYPTKIGTIYPGLERDLLGEMIDACHAKGIGVSAYLNVGLNHELVRRRPEWLRVNKDGSTQEENVMGNFFRTPCMYSGYVDYLLDEIREIMEKKPDGIFCDCLIPKRCYCPRCQEKMLAAGVDMEDDLQVYQFAFQRMREVAQLIRSIVPNTMRLFFNSYPYDLLSDLCSHTELECLPTDTKIWGYDFFLRNAPYYRMFSKNRLYMTGRFVNSWGDYGGYRNAASMESDVFDALMYGFAPSIGDHMDPVNGLDKTLYRQIGEMYEKVEALEPYLLDAEPVIEAAILRNKSGQNGGANASVTGATKMLSDMKLCFDVINEDFPLDKYRLLILPDGLAMTDKLKAKLNAFRGSILSCGNSLDTDGRWNFISHVEPDTNKDGFYPMADRKVAMYSLSIKMKSSFSVADYIEPCFDRCFDGQHSYFYIPPGKSSGFSAIAKKDNTVHICFDIFRAYKDNDAEYLRETLWPLVDALLPDPLLAGKFLPTLFRATLMRGKTDILQIKSTVPSLWGNTGKIPEHVTFAKGLQIGVKGEYAQARTIPHGEPLQTEISGGRTWITLGKLTGYTAIELI